MKLIILPEAQADVVSAHDWYESQKLGLGAEFLSHLQETLRSINDYPESYEVFHRMVRQAGVHRFPYIVYYRIGIADIEVWAVLHASRHARVWKKRMDR